VSTGSTLLAALAGGGLVSGGWAVYSTNRARRDEGTRDAARLLGAKRSVAADWIAYSSFMESSRGVVALLRGMQPATDAWPRHADEISMALSQDDWSDVVLASLIVDSTRRRVDALTQRPLSRLAGGRTRDVGAAFNEEDLATIHRGIAVLDPDTWRGLPLFDGRDRGPDPNSVPTSAPREKWSGECTYLVPHAHRIPALSVAPEREVWPERDVRLGSALVP
jgi:hypothetical protein